MRKQSETIELGWLSSVHHVKKASSASHGVMCNVIGQQCDSERWPSSACILQPHFPGLWEGCQCYWSMGALALIMSNPLHVHFPSLLSSGLHFASASQSLRAASRAPHTRSGDVASIHPLFFSYRLTCSLFFLLLSPQSAPQTTHTSVAVLHTETQGENYSRRHIATAALNENFTKQTQSGPD